VDEFNRYVCFVFMRLDYIRGRFLLDGVERVGLSQAEGCFPVRLLMAGVADVRKKPE